MARRGGAGLSPARAPACLNRPDKASGVGRFVMYRGGPDARPAAATALTRYLDRALDLAVLAFAGWTLLYHLDLALHLPTTPLLFLWALFMLVAYVGYVLLRRRSRPLRAATGGPAPAEQDDETPAARAERPVPVPVSVPVPVPGSLSVAVSVARPAVAIAAGVAAGVTAGLSTSGALPWAVPATLGLAGVVLTGAPLLSTRGRERERWRATPPAPVGGGSVLALLTAIGLAIISLFTVNTDADDAYFVSRSVWIGVRGRIPLKDVIFTDQGVGHIAGEVPVSSIEAWNGALAHLFGVSGASFTWYVFLPAATFGAVWALWRLTRLWAPRRLSACVAVAVVYLLWSGTSVSSLGSFHFLRMWQGKAAFVSLLVPLCYAYLTVWAERRERRALVLAVAAGVCAVGLTSTAVFLMPLMVASVAVPLLAARRVRAGLAACAAAGYPVAAGLGVALLARNQQVTGVFREADAAYALVLLTGVMGAASGCALWVGPWLTRRGTPALIVTGIAAMTTVLLIPGVLDLIRGLIPADAVLWRVPWIAPVPVLVGLIAGVRIPAPAGGRRPALVAALALAPALAVSVAVIVGGQPLWSQQDGTTLAARPAWKANAEYLRAARTVVKADTGGGTILAPYKVMRYVPLLTTTEHAAVPNLHYLQNLPAAPTFIHDRELLGDMASRNVGPYPSVRNVDTALDQVGVTYACVWSTDKQGLRLLKAAGFGHQRRIDRLRCLSR
jgi:hypothetical protein